MEGLKTPDNSLPERLRGIDNSLIDLPEEDLILVRDRVDRLIGEKRTSTKTIEAVEVGLVKKEPEKKEADFLQEIISGADPEFRTFIEDLQIESPEALDGLHRIVDLIDNLDVDKIRENKNAREEFALSFVEPSEKIMDYINGKYSGKKQGENATTSMSDVMVSLQVRLNKMIKEKGIDIILLMAGPGYPYNSRTMHAPPENRRTGLTRIVFQIKSWGVFSGADDRVLEPMVVVTD